LVVQALPLPGLVSGFPPLRHPVDTPKARKTVNRYAALNKTEDLPGPITEPLIKKSDAS
jgi:hypothetical protein